MTDEMMVAIIVDSLIDKGYCDVTDFDSVGKTILNKLKRYRTGSVAAQSIDRIFSSGVDDNVALSPQSVDLFYSAQSVMNERTKPNAGNRLNTEYCLERNPVLPGTLQGTIYLKTELKDTNGRNGVAIQTFKADSKGDFIFTDLDSPKVKVNRGNVIHDTGEILLEWNEKPGVNVCVFNYEYNASSG